MSRIVVDPEELTRFAALSTEAADDHAARAARLRAMDVPPMPPDVEQVVRRELDRIAATLDSVASSLYGEALLLRSRAGMFDSAVRESLIRAFTSRPG